MVKNTTKPEITDKGGFFEYILLAVCLAAIALRATLTEAPYTNGASADNIFITASSAFLIFAAISWFVSNICKKNFSYRISGIEYGLAIFVIASIVGICVASNKRAAINDFTMLVAPMLMAVLLTQILNKNIRVKVLLYVFAALGVVNAYECFDQYRTSNQMTVSEYERNPNLMLKRLNIEKESFQQMLFEHRLYSKDIRGFFTTGNSAGSFLLLALAAATVLVIEKRKALKAGVGSTGELAARGLIAAAILLGFGLSRSKGAVAAACAAAILFIIYKIKGKQLARHKLAVLAFVLLIIAACGCGIIWYGITHGTLPGGKSMMVRWEYWGAAARIIAAHPFTGTGPGSFAEYYPTYKIPAAIEVVKDPHNFILSILTQYGPLGLVGFLAALLIPLGYTIFSAGAVETLPEKTHQSFKKIALSFLLLIIGVMLAIRPLVMRSELGNTTAVMLVVITWLYILPVAIFTAAFFFLSINDKQTFLDRGLQAVLFCAIIGVLIHNLVDFALFEPGVYTAFWALLAAIAALDFNLGKQKELSVRPSLLSAILITVCGFAFLGAYTFFCVMPVIKTSIKIGSSRVMLESAAGYADSNSILPNETQANILQGAFDYANRQLYSAADDDKLNPDAPAFNASLCVRFYEMQGRKDSKMLEWAQNRLLLAIQRDPADFKNYEKLAEVFMLMADQLPADEQPEILEKAYNAITKSLARYPGCDRLLMQAGRLAERLGKKSEAIEYYGKAIEIEKAYRTEFAKMFPEKPVFSRMGESQYKFAQERLSELSGPRR